MRELLTYIAQVSLLAACSYLIYKAVFARDTFHRIRRFLLLLLIAASFALPVCRITVVREVETTSVPTAEATTGESPVLTAQATQTLVPPPLPSSTTSDPWRIALDIIGIIYLAGVAFLLAYRLAGVVKVRRIMRRAVYRYSYEGVEVLLTAENIPPFSFAGKIVMSMSDFKSVNYLMIFRHEVAHIRQRHGLDLATVNIVQALLWFNPFVWLLRRELVLVHELAADSGVIRSGIDAKKYQYLLISKSARAAGLLPVANQFRTSDLRKRIMTMNRKTSRAAALKLLLLPPFIAVALVAFARTHYVTAEAGTTEQAATDSLKNVTVHPERGKFSVPFLNAGVEKDKDGRYIVSKSGRFRFSANYGKRVNPVTGKEGFHRGIDVVPPNDTVVSPYSGVVKSAAVDRNYGNKLVISHGGGLETTWAHLASFLVSEGATVESGQPIAVIGNTGLSAGKHLHLETRVDGELTDPMKTLFDAEVYLSGKAAETGGEITLNNLDEK